MNTKISIIIVNYNAGHFLTECLQSIIAANYNGDLCLQVIVVDNKSSDDSLCLAMKSFPNVEYIGLPHNMGFGHANNIGLQKAKGDYILFLNPDTVVLPDALSILLTFMDNTQQAGACGGKILNPDGSIQHAYPRRYGHINLWISILKNIGLLKLLEKIGILQDNLEATPIYDKVREAGPIHGCFFMVRYQIALDLKGFDERFFMYGESEDLSLRINKARWKTYYVPDAVIIHYGQISTNKAASAMAVESVRSGFLFHRKHGGWHAAFIYRFAMIIKYTFAIIISTMTQKQDKIHSLEYLTLWKWLALNKRP